MLNISNIRAKCARFLDKCISFFSLPNYAEAYLAKSIDRADFDYREKYLKQIGLLWKLLKEYYVLWLKVEGWELKSKCNVMSSSLGNIKFCSFDTIKLGNWLLKISSLDNHILIHSINIVTDEYELRSFLDELEAFNYMEMLNG